MDYYWELILKEGDTIDISPAGVDVVKRRMGNKEAINLKNRSIPYSEIKDFRQSDKPYGQPLIEAAAQAFKEPMHNENGSLVVQWVKKSVSQKAYEKLYAATPAYRKLDDDNGRIVVAFRVPLHEVNTATLTPCTPDEIAELTRK